MKVYDVVILTEPRYIDTEKITDVNKNVFLEDNLVLDALKKLGLKTLRLSWDDPNFDWSTTKYILFRSTWDYFYRFNEFSQWLDQVSKQTKLLNSESIIRWNIDKHYLNDLETIGIHCAPSLFIEIGSKQTLVDIYRNNNFNEIVLKPVFSGTARHTYKINQENRSDYEAIFKELIVKESMMIQPFQYDIIKTGEKSLVLIDGQFTHAVLKMAKKGDFRVQDNFGGSVREYHPTKEEITFAENAVQVCKPSPIYARVDIFNDNDGHIALAELELVEPELWFRNNPTAANLLAAAIKKIC